MRFHPSILLVEDDEDVADIILDVLEEADCHAHAVRTMAEALRVIQTENVDLIILDRNLPDGRGDHLCRTVKSRDGAVFLPILMLTAHSSVADRITGLQVGADDYLTKPFDIDELLARVRALLRIRRAEVDRVQALVELQQQHEELKATYEQLRATQAQLIQSSKLAALGSLIAGVTHELNNPLAIILGNAELLQTFSDDELSVSQIINATQRARRVVQSLATFARQGPGQKDWYEPRDLIERVLDLRRTALEHEGISVEVVYEPDVPMVCVNREQIQHALLNLLLNAEHAFNGHADKRIEIHVSRATVPAAPPPVLPDLPKPAMQSDAGTELLLIDVMDNGPGIDGAITERLFEPFVTTSPLGKNIGLGLSTAYGTVTQHGGTLQASTEQGRGTTMRIALPVARIPHC